MMRPLLLCVGMVWMVSAAAGPNAIRVRITGLQSNTGTVHCALHAQANGFPSANAFQNVSGTLAGGEGRCEFAAVAVGRYAISAIHDVDGNGRLDTGWFGIPTEPWAASRDAPARFGPARFDDARFDYRGGLVELTIKAQ